MTNLNWGDELCGVKVTPESWEGGVIDYGAPMHWRIHPYTMMLIVDMPKYAAQGIPIFPPRGWAGKTDAELWAAVFGGRGLNVGVGVTMFYEDSDTRIAWSNGLWSPLAYPDFPPTALILALQNAQVLARRLA